MILDELTRTVSMDPNAVSAAHQFFTKINDLPQDRFNAKRRDDRMVDYLADTGLVDHMKNLGWTEAHTEGYYSSVFAKPGESYVMKVNKRVDQAYAWFAFLTRKFPNEHFPKIGNAKIVKFGKEKYWIYAIEKLEPIANQDDAEATALLCRYSCDKDYDLQAMMKYGAQVADRRPFLKDQYMSIVAACQIIKKYNRGYYCDIHFKNVMQRANGTVVITDPYV